MIAATAQVGAAGVTDVTNDPALPPRTADVLQKSSKLSVFALVRIASKIQHSLEISGIRVVKSTTRPSRKRGPDGATYKPAVLELAHGGQHESNGDGSTCRPVLGPYEDIER